MTQIPAEGDGAAHAEWRVPQADPALADGDVHVWRAGLDVGGEEAAALERMLSGEERERAARFRFARDRHRFVVARGRLRDILARYLGSPAAAIEFEYAPGGKPRLAGDPIHFNLSHSGETALVAVSRDRAVGVDVEVIDERRATSDIAERFFSPVEREALAVVSAARRAGAFFECWTRKEAFLKAIGTGLSRPLDSFTAWDGSAAEVSVVEGITVRSLRPGDGLAGAVAAEGRDWRHACWVWTPAAPPGSPWNPDG